MTAASRSSRRCRRDEQGVAMLIAVTVMLVGSLLAVTTFSEALHGLSSTSLTRNRVESVAAAEAGLNQAFSTLQGTSALPCTSTTSTPAGLPAGLWLPPVDVSDLPIAASASYTLTYYDTYPPAGATPDTNCSSGVQGGTPQAVEVTSTGIVNGATNGERTMQALVRLIPSSPSGLTAAIYTQNSLTFLNAFTINGQLGHGNNAGVYLNGNNNETAVSCPNGSAIYGSLYLPQTGVSLGNYCHVLGDVWAYGDVSANNNVIVDGYVRSTDGNITLANSATVNSALAYGTITPPCPNPSVVNICASHDTTLGPVPTETFPTVNYGSAWTAAGFTRYDDNNNCTSPPPSGQTTVYQDIAAMSTVTTPTVIATTCALNYSGLNNLTTSADLAIFAEGGITTKNQFSLTPADGKVHNLYLIVPSGTPCPNTYGSGNIALGNLTSFDASATSYMNVLLYTPCNISSGNNATFYGQIYAGGSASFTNSFTMNFVPMSVPGVNGVTTPPTPTYNAQVAYVRETINP